MIKILTVSVILLTSCFSDASLCNNYMKEQNDVLNKILQYQKARNIEIAKMKSRSFQANLIEMRSECKDLPGDLQKKVDKRINELNKIEKALFESGYLRGMSK